MLRAPKLQAWQGNSIHLPQLRHKTDLPLLSSNFPSHRVDSSACVRGRRCSPDVTWPDVPADPRAALSGSRGSGVFALRGHSTDTNSTDRARGHSALSGRHGRPCGRLPPAGQKPARTLKPQLRALEPGPHPWPPPASLPHLR